MNLDPLTLDLNLSQLSIWKGNTGPAS